MTKKTTGISPLQTTYNFLTTGTCSETMCHTINCAFNNSSKPEENAVMPHAGGIMQYGYQCGMLWGAVLAAGAEAYRRYGGAPETEARAVMAARDLVNLFQAQNNGHINCLEITDIDKSSSVAKQILYFLVKGGTIGCVRRCNRFAGAAVRTIDEALSRQIRVSGSSCSNCASMLAGRLGFSGRHAVMAAGLAGGIGLCGGACGALGAAIWLLSMRHFQAIGKREYKYPKARKVMEKFLKVSGFLYECREITGQLFEDGKDHADFLRNGGCGKIIDFLANELSDIRQPEAVPAETWNAHVREAA
jgi:hypothetical protein